MLGLGRVAGARRYRLELEWSLKVFYSRLAHSSCCFGTGSASQRTSDTGSHTSDVYETYKPFLSIRLTKQQTSKAIKSIIMDLER
ncbi:uncharacterized protein MYCFIDRAFT_169351 [Pseudocercospora fijiensis CIRAD86]|uniref:Uncharacterized protein n=1 Tax=Pseudocercospora fijiensis (strain CIRAD86) TaxID=383855 RepID=N1Q5Z1_PSEFD|nr:uncharacterized protein MYCFIDRAFT_169351 [Pseudocercospora fijiensis CIRAD86]EME87535.1 hypothetical protein MYCFIDRAFT_169351 [Pseudocercospora fijiensis CIRAD86]